jgi:hypothetical protein
LDATLTMPPDQRHWPLPLSKQVDVAALSRIFADTTSSYKYLWFQALLQRMTATGFRQPTLNLAELFEAMLVRAWYPSVFFRLSFGSQDRIGHWFDRYQIQLDGAITENDVAEAIRFKLCNGGSDMGLLRYVPFRSLAPFFDEELKGCKDYRRNILIRELADTNFISAKPIYRFKSEHEIEVHPDWMEYIASNLAFVSGWANWSWIQYLQQRNPNAPAIANKVGIPCYRQPLERQKEFWLVAFQHAPMRCLYSGEVLTPINMALDHFLPWSFVGHDQLWNLVPVSHRINSGKSNRIPDACYLDQLAALHHFALRHTRENMSAKKWQQMVQSYVNDFRLESFDALSDVQRLKAAYHATMRPLMQIAELMGFPARWHYENIP